MLKHDDGTYIKEKATSAEVYCKTFPNGRLARSDDFEDWKSKDSIKLVCLKCV